MPTKNSLVGTVSILLAFSCNCSSNDGETSGETVSAESAAGIDGVSDADGTSGVGGTSGLQELGTGNETARELTLLVTNDDGVDADGIDLLVEELRKLPMVRVVVVAPATNQSLTGRSTTSGTISHRESTTKSGYPAEAIDGYPADSIIVALDELGIEPDFVLSGTNAGANTGIILGLSGTVGAAWQAAKMGVPALALSQEVTASGTDYAASVKVAIDWFKANRSAIEARTLSTSTIVCITAPSCAPDTTIRGTVEVPASDTFTLQASDCASTLTDPADDVTAVLNGYASIIPDLPVPES